MCVPWLPGILRRAKLQKLTDAHVQMCVSRRVHVCAMAQENCAARKMTDAHVQKCVCALLDVCVDVFICVVWLTGILWHARLQIHAYISVYALLRMCVSTYSYVWCDSQEFCGTQDYLAPEVFTIAASRTKGEVGPNFKLSCVCLHL